jgi:hypothetical protein
VGASMHVHVSACSSARARWRVRVCVYHIVTCGLLFPPFFFGRNLISGTIFGKKLLNIICVFRFSQQLLHKAFFILRRIKRDIAINVKTSSRKVPVIPVGF